MSVELSPELETEDKTLVYDTVLQGVTAYINAGGRGTRLNRIFKPHPRRGISKALLEIGNPPLPLIDHHIHKLDEVGAPVILAGVGDHANVAKHVRKTFANRTHIYATESDRILGNGGDLMQAVRKHGDLFGDQILINNVDTILDLDEVALLKQHRRTESDLTIALTRRQGVPNEDAYYVSHNSRVVHCLEASDAPTTPEKIAEMTAYRGSSTGALVIRKDLLDEIHWSPDDGQLSLYRDVIGFALRHANVSAFNNGQRLFTDVGTVDTWHAAQQSPEALQPYLHYNGKL